jgi:hypothetical protein
LSELLKNLLVLSVADVRTRDDEEYGLIFLCPSRGAAHFLA